MSETLVTITLYLWKYLNELNWRHFEQTKWEDIWREDGHQIGSSSASLYEVKYIYRLSQESQYISSQVILKPSMAINALYAHLFYFL